MDTINLVFKLVNNFKILFRNRWCDGIPGKAMVFPRMRQALHHLVDHCLSNMNNSKINLACTLDLSKGFDTLNHTILLHKLQNYGITGHSLSWFKSDLSDRSQIVRIGNKLSQLVNISMGVPQGTCLGPILFLLYVNNLSDYITSSLTAMYADDTTFVSSGTSEI